MTSTAKKYTLYGLPKNTPHIALTSDDDKILLEVHRHTIIDANTVYALLPHRKEDAIRRRLNKLRKARYLTRLSQLEEVFVPGGGSLPKAYTLAHAGAMRLNEVFGLPVRPKRFRNRDGSSDVAGRSAQHVLHAIEQTRFLVQVRKAAQARNDIEFLYPEQIYERYAPHLLESDLPSIVKARVHWFNYHQEEGTIPDGFFMLYYPHMEQGKNRRSIFLEIDRGTETIDVSDKKITTLKFWKDSSILRKFVVYAYAFRSEVHKKKFGIPTFQVLTVTTNVDRIAKMQRMYQRRLAGKPHSVKPWRYLFTDFETLERHKGDIFAVPIVDGEGSIRFFA